MIKENQELIEEMLREERRLERAISRYGSYLSQKGFDGKYAIDNLMRALYNQAACTRCTLTIENPLEK